jgi:hypothetical protein
MRATRHGSSVAGPGRPTGQLFVSNIKGSSRRRRGGMGHQHGTRQGCIVYIFIVLIIIQRTGRKPRTCTPPLAHSARGQKLPNINRPLTNPPGASVLTRYSLWRHAPSVPLLAWILRARGWLLVPPRALSQSSLASSGAANELLK